MVRTTEALVLVLTCLSPWPFASVQPRYEFLLDLGIALLTVLWGARMLLAGTVSWRKCPVTACLAALVLLGLAQSIPLP
jgi:hypothetical protein